MRKHRIFVVGMLSIEYVRQNWLDIMREMYDITYVSVSILNRVMSKDELTEYLLTILHSGDYDYVFVYPDGCHQMFSDLFFAEAKKNAPVISFYSDDEPDEWMNNNLKYDFRSDLIVTHSDRAYKYRKNAGYNDGVIRVQWGYNPAFFYKTDDEKDIDVVFMGSNFFVDGKYIYDGFLRQQILTDVYNFCAKKGYVFRLYGARWNLHPVLKDAWGGFASDEEIVHVINRARIVLGLGYTQDESPSFHTKLKHFEIAGCGSFELVNKNPDLYDIFKDSMPQFDDSEELCDQIGYYLSHEEEREKKAADAYAICKASCTMKHRIRTIFDYADKHFNNIRIEESNNAEHTEHIRIKQIICDENDSVLKNAFDYLKNPDKNVTHIQILDNNSMLLDQNIELIKGRILGNETIGCKTLFSLCNAPGYDLSKEQRRCLDDNAWLAGPGVNRKSGWFDFSQNHLRGFEKDGKFYPLCTFLLDEKNSAKILKAFLSSDSSWLEKVIIPDCIINDIRILDDDERYKNREAKALSAFLENAPKDALVVVWGAYGNLLSQVFEAINNSLYECKIIFVDKNSDMLYVEVGTENEISQSDKKIFPLINSAEMLEKKSIRPYAVVITSIFNGESMRNTLMSKQINCKVLPLYNLEDDAWKQEGIIT